MKTVNVPVESAAPLEVPSEIREFLKTSGNVLLVRGTAGAGKTTFALEAMRVLTDPARAVYLTSRTNDVMLYSHFPWISDEWRRQVVDTSAMLRDQFFAKDPKVVPEGEAPPTAADNMKRLRRFLGGALATKLTPADVERLTETDGGIGSSNIVVLDSLEGLAGPLGRESNAFFQDFREIAVDDYDASVIVVLEHAGPSPIDYLADGIVEMRVERKANCLVREMRIEKLRGVTINNPSYLYSLEGGRFQAFGPERGGRFLPRVPRAPEVSDRLSTGVASLDDALGGGYPWGSTILLEFDEDVEDQLLHSLVYRPLSVALQQDQVAYLYPPFGQDAWAAYESLAGHLPPTEVVDERLRISTYATPEEQNEQKPYIMRLDIQPDETVPAAARHYAKVFEWLGTMTEGDRRKAVLAVSWDQAELQYDARELEIILGRAANQVQTEDWILLIFRKRERGRERDVLPKVARVHVRVDTMEKVPLLTVERPYLGAFGLREDAGGIHAVPFR